MTTFIIDAVLHEANWMPVAMALAGLAVVGRVRATSHSSSPVGTLGAMCLFYGVMLGIMSAGHLLAVSLSAARGTLEGSPWFLYPLGILLTIPAWWLAATSGRLRNLDEGPALTRVVGLNGWLGVGLLSLGLHNWPLAAPSVLNIAYRYHRRRAAGHVIVAVVSVGYLVLLVGSVVFMTSGQTFEEFQGIAN